MKTCNCSGNNSLRSAIGAIRCDCGGKLELPQVIQRIISRLNEIDDEQSRIIQGLVAADMDACDKCKEWFKEKEVIRAGDRALCSHCFYWEHFCREDDDEETLDHVLPQLLKRILGTEFYKRLPHDRNGLLAEPFLKHHKALMNLA